MSDALADPQLWKNLTIPFVAAFVGWITNWIAIEMTFRPLEFRGVRPWLGWQGIIPSKATKMATIFVDRTMFRLGTLREVFHYMDPERVAQHVSAIMDQRLDAYTDEVMFYSHPSAWRMLPEAMKDGIRRRVRAEMPRLVRNLMHEAAENVEELVDFKDMLVRRLEGDKRLLNRLFLEAGAAEFRFIILSGAYFGFLFGLVQLGVWLFYQAWWVLPAFGLAVGYATNWFALEIIFRPLRPVRVGPVVVQGLFLKRQAEVAVVWCRIVTTEILTVQQIVYAMLFGPRAERTRALIRKHIEPVVDDALRAYQPLSDLAVGPERLERIRETVAAKAVVVSTDPFDHWPFNRERGRVIEEALRERMQRMPPEEFQDLLRPCFQEDEMKLILAGAVLGLLAGFVQMAFMF